jgi:TolB-like protein
LGKLFEELKRRNVFRVAVAYVVTSWLVLQVADVVLNNIEAPGWVFSVFLLALGLGFLPIIFFSWAYELTPDGLKKESEVDRTSSITDETGRKLNFVTMAMLAAVVIFVFVERSLFDVPRQDEVEAASAMPEVAEPQNPIDDKSIAVLAFEDLSELGDQAFFAEGLSEELLNVLAQVPSLKVAGRTSSFAFKGKDTDLREIGEMLNVAHILEGSVRKAGDRIRVTAQLIKAADGFHLFSKTYDRDLDDIFEVQDELAKLIGDALQAQISGETDVLAVTPTAIEAYDLYLLARQRISTRNPDLMEEALEMLDGALDIDPAYAPAMAQKALVTRLLSNSPGAYGDIPEEFALSIANDLIDRALALDSNLAEAYAVRGLLQYTRLGGLEDATASLNRALEINPNLQSAKLWLANAQIDSNESIRLYEEILLRDPMYAPAFNNLIQDYMGQSEFDKSDALVTRVSRITGPDDNVRQAQGTIAYMRGELADARRHLDFAFDANPNGSVVRVWRGYTLLQLGEFGRAALESVDGIRLIGMRESGDLESADTFLRDMDFLVGDQGRKLQHAADYLASVDRAEEVPAVVSSNYGSVAELLEVFPDLRYGTDHLGPLAYAYRSVGMLDEYQLFVEDMKRNLDEQRAEGIDNWFHWYCQAQYAALISDADAAIAHLQHALDSGFVSVLFVEPLFELLATDPRFGEIENTARARANTERVKLGLDPYQPISDSY